MMLCAIVSPHVRGVMSNDVRPRKGAKDGWRMRTTRTREVHRSLPNWREGGDRGTSRVSIVIVLFSTIGREWELIAVPA